MRHKIRLVWWNVGISPARSNRKKELQSLLELTVHIESLFSENLCDFLAICEVNSDDILVIQDAIRVSDLEFMDLTEVAGRTRFDIAVVYNKNKISVQHAHNLVNESSGNTIKAAQVVKIFHCDEPKEIYIYLCHWASKLRGEGETKRKLAADAVYRSAIELSKKHNDVIIMGDFNANPYEQPMIEGLQALRCHDAVIKSPLEYFYNPFWRTLISENQYDVNNQQHSFRTGTLGYRELNGPHWHSYDQALLSGSFLANGPWYLNERETKVLDEDKFLKEFNDKSKKNIDHLPIICEINKL